MSDLTTMHCDDCGQTGRTKEMLFIDWDAIGYYCHDEEKSCYNFVVMKVA